MTVHLLLEPLNLTMRQGTIAKCLEHSTAPSVPLFLACHQTHGQIATLILPFASCSSKILTQSFTTMWLDTPYHLVNFLSCSRATVSTWQGFLPTFQSFWLVPMPAPQASFLLCRVRVKMPALLLVVHVGTSLSSVGAYLLYAPTCFIQDCNSHNLHLDDRPWLTHLGPRITKLQMSSPHSPNPTTTLPQEDHPCPQTCPIGICLGKAPDGQPASTHLAWQITLWNQSNPMLSQPPTQPKWWSRWYDWSRKWHPDCLWNVSTRWTPLFCDTNQKLSHCVTSIS